MQVRHGDLLVESIESIPAGAREKQDNILAYGTATGHSHRLIGGTVFEDYQGNMFVRATNQGSLTHEKEGGSLSGDHNTIPLPAGNYAVIFQREFNPYENNMRRVQD
jgi:hypothetical protein